MNTLIEIYDERPLENVLAVEVFRPERVVFLCPSEIARDKTFVNALKRYFAHHDLSCEIVIRAVSLYKAAQILTQLEQLAEKWPDCALDITGGTDAALFAAGLFAASHKIPVFTYSRRQNKFYDIANAEFADELPCSIVHGVADCFLMAGGAVRSGRVDNAILPAYLSYVDGFFDIFLRYRKKWPDLTTYVQRVSRAQADGSYSLTVHGAYTVKGERSGRINCDTAWLKELEALGFIHGLSINGKESVSFTFKDAQVRAWLRDVGSVLELYVYKACLDADVFQDVSTSVIVDWEGDAKQNDVTNELDVVAVHEITPAFISCKTGAVKTEALNELVVLRDRFGSNIARAAIVTATKVNAATLHRAAELEITVIDQTDLTSGSFRRKLAALSKPLH